MMSLAKAATALNKLLHGEDKQKECYLLTQLPPPYHLTTFETPEEDFLGHKPVCTYWTKNESRIGKLENLLSNTSLERIYMDHPNASVSSDVKNTLLEESNSSQTRNLIGTLAVSSSGILNRSKESGTSVSFFTLPQRSQGVLPYIEKILTVERKSLDDNDEFTPLDPSKYKTELCRSYQVHGFCKYGNKCNYAHGLPQLRISFRHGKYKTRNCQSYHETGFCRYGARCSFIHDVEEGILKCPITDREILEALHYDPTRELHHVATITWRMLEQKCHPPTEVHFFTSPYNAISDSSFDDNSFSLKDVQSQTSIEDITTRGELSMESELCEDRMLTSEEQQSSSNKDTTASSSIEFCRMNPTTDDKDIIQDNYNKKESDNLLTKLDQEIESGNCEKEDYEIRESKFPKPNQKQNKSCQGNLVQNQENSRNTLRSILDDTEYKLCRRRRSSQAHTASKNSGASESSSTQIYKFEEMKYSQFPQSFSGFRLEDFLNCLKTREGRHLTTWKAAAVRSNSALTTDFSPVVQSNSSGYSLLRPLSCQARRDWAKYKTELCRSYQYNKYCEYSDSCLYAHGTQDLRTYPKHPLYRTKKCFSFHKKGFCLYGSRCQFLHDIN